MRIKVEYKDPRELEEIIKKSIIGQTEGIKAIATALAAHLLRIKYSQENSGCELKKDNILVIGPPGCGKTESIRTVIRELDLPIPVAVVSSNMLTGSGWKGKETSSILADLSRACKPILLKHAGEFCLSTELYRKDKEQYNKNLLEAKVELCNQGIIVLDEFDKIRTHPDQDRQEDFFPKIVQHELLKMIEGGSGFDDNPLYSRIDTTGILFICAGAFTDLYQTNQPGKKMQGIGFSAGVGNNPQPEDCTEHSFKMPTTEELIKMGYMPELVGRVPMRTEFKKLSEESLFKILKYSNISPVIDLQKLFGEAGYVLEFTEEALETVANLAYRENTGARGLRTVLTEKIYPVLYSLPKGGCKVTIDSDVFTQNAIANISSLDECESFEMYHSQLLKDKEFCNMLLCNE